MDKIFCNKHEGITDDNNILHRDSPAPPPKKKTTMRNIGLGSTRTYL